MDLNLKNRKVLITGVGDGIGREFALAFAEEGAQVAGCARTQNRLDSLSEEIVGENHLFRSVDVTQPESLKNFYSEMISQFKGLDILVNNVGNIGKLANFFDLTDEDWKESFEINLLSAVRLCRLCIPDLKQSNQPRIINISSIAGSRPMEIFPHYSAMKAGLSNLTSSLSQTLASDKILVNSISPGPVWSRSWEKEAQEGADHSGKSKEQMIREIQNGTSASIPLKRMGIPEDVSGLVLFLASKQANWITGTNFNVDGGVLQNPY